MLFPFVAYANDNNWLHDTILEMLTLRMDEIDGETDHTNWPDCIPELRREELSPKTSLRDRSREFLEAYEGLSVEDRARVRDAIQIQNAFPAIFDGHSPWVRLVDLPAAIQQPSVNLFRAAFRLLTPLELRDQQYQIIYDNLPHRICPFCGVEILDAPGQPREDLDHYLPISAYPFAGANLRNLSPMGNKCNASFKHTQDVIYDTASGTRRRCCDPYGGPPLAITLNNSVPFEGATVRMVTCPAWDVEIIGDAELAATWDAVFQIKSRYVQSHLNQEFRDWVDHFAKWCGRSDKSFADVAGAVATITEYIEATIQEGFADRAFLKRAVFEMLRLRVQGGDGRLTEWLKDNVQIYREPEAA
jgi:hypothetical protein